MRGHVSPENYSTTP